VIGGDPVGAILVAAGRSTRMGFDKLWADLGGRPVLAWSAAVLAASGSIDRLVVVAAAERRAGLEAGVGREEQYRVVPNGVALERFAAEPRPVPGRVLMLGRLARQKRPDVAVTAFARARRDAGHARLVIGGDGPDRDAVEAQIAAEGLGDSVELLGTHGDVPSLLAEAHCLLLASDYEGCPYSVIEAMAAGVPVVATRAGGVPELVEDGRTGLLADTGDAEGLARALATVLADPESARRLGAAGREVARRRLSVERMAADVERVYDEVAGDSPRAS
jgi:glycosyltransferase involved in cell wall biosynthesis